MIARWRRATLALKCTLYYRRNISALRSIQPRGTGNEHTIRSKNNAVACSTQFCALDNYKRRRVPSSFGFSCRLIAARECLTRPNFLSGSGGGSSKRVGLKALTRRVQVMTSCDPFHQPALRAGMLWLQLLGFLLLKASFTIGLTCGGEKYKFCTTGVKVPGSESSSSFSLSGAKVPGNESSRERKYVGTKVPVTTWSLLVLVLMLQGLALGP